MSQRRGKGKDFGNLILLSTQTQRRADPGSCSPRRAPRVPHSSAPALGLMALPSLSLSTLLPHKPQKVLSSHHKSLLGCPGTQKPIPCSPVPTATLLQKAGASSAATLSRTVAELEALTTCFTGTSDISKIVFILAWNEDKYFRNFLDNIKF